MLRLNCPSQWTQVRVPRHQSWPTKFALQRASSYLATRVWSWQTLTRSAWPSEQTNLLASSQVTHITHIVCQNIVMNAKHRITITPQGNSSGQLWNEPSREISDVDPAKMLVARIWMFGSESEMLGLFYGFPPQNSEHCLLRCVILTIWSLWSRGWPLGSLWPPWEKYLLAFIMRFFLPRMHRCCRDRSELLAQVQIHAWRRKKLGFLISLKFPNAPGKVWSW